VPIRVGVAFESSNRNDPNKPFSQTFHLPDGSGQAL
jgi:hypothetical protein